MSSKRRSPHTHTRMNQDQTPTPAQPQTQDDPSPMPDPRTASSRVSHDHQRIGDILRRVREHRGEDIESISDYLRIRPQYLVALENSQYEDLPADAYVIGFLRTYALYLGLDGRGAIDQYRREMAGRRKKPQLTMPQPMSESQAPTIALLAGAAIAAILIYALWYGLSSPDKAVVEQPVPLPQTAQEITATTPASTDSGIALTATSTSAPLQDIAPVIIDQTGTKPDAKTQVPTETPSSPATADKKDGKEILKDKPKMPEGVPATTTPAPVTPNATTPATTNPQQMQIEPAKTEIKTDKKSEETKPVPTPTPAADKGKSTVTIRANEPSWVLVTDSKGVTIFDRTLKAGETYQVPAGKGLSLTTGNAAGITFLNDGAELPRLKTSGKVLRAISLEPDKLKAKLSKPDAAETAPTE